MQFVDLSSEAYLNVSGRVGSSLTVVADKMLAGLGNKAPVETANLLPAGFGKGIVAYAYEQLVNQHFADHADQDRNAYPTAAREASPQG